MDSIKAKILSQVPPSEPLMNGLIEDVKEISQHVTHPNIKNRKPEACNAVADVMNTILPILEKLNPLGFFFKDNHEFKDFLHALEQGTQELVKLLRKIVGMTCITKLCLLVKLLKKFEQLKDEFEIKKSKSDLILRGT